MSLDTTNNNNVVLGHDGLFYEPSCLFRSSKITKQTGEVVADLNYVNVLDQNLKHYSKGCNQVVSDAIFSGAGHRTPQGGIVSIFNNEYSDQYPTIRAPLSALHPGTLSQMPAVPFGNQDVEFRYLLEPQYNVLMRAVPSGVYDAGSASVQSYAFENIVSGATTLYASELGDIGEFSTGDTIIVKGLVGGGTGYDTFIRTITGAITQDAGVTPGHFSINTALSGSASVSAISVGKESNTYELGCVSVEATTTALTLITQTAQNVDLYAGTDVIVHYNLLTASGSLIADSVTPTTLRTKIASLTLNGSNIAGVVLQNGITLAANQSAISIWIEPLYTNLDSNNWSVVSAHLVLYRRNVKVPMGKSIVSNFESVNVQCVAGLNRFMYNYKINSNCYGVWAIQPTNTNLYSVQHDIEQYLFSVDEKPVTSIYVNTGSSVHQDNLGRCFGNSQVYKLKNLKGNRDVEIQSEIEPIIFPAKVFNATHKGEENVQPMGQDKNLRIELVPATATEACVLFLFMEKFQEI